MNKKKKINIVVIVPTIVTVIIAAALIYFVLQVGSVSSGPDHGVHDELPGSYQRVDAGEGDYDCTFPHLVGHMVDDAFLQATGRAYRVLPPNAMATMDFLPERINIHTDKYGRVTDIRCG